MNIEDKIVFGKIMGTLYAIYNNTTVEDRIPDYIIGGLSHGVEPIIDDMIDGGSFSLSSEDYKDMLKMMEEKENDDIKGLYDIDLHKRHSNYSWKIALSLMKDRGQFLDMINKIEGSQYSPAEITSLTLSKLPISYLR